MFAPPIVLFPTSAWKLGTGSNNLGTNLRSALPRKFLEYLNSNTPNLLLRSSWRRGSVSVRESYWSSVYQVMEKIWGKLVFGEITPRIWAESTTALTPRILALAMGGLKING
jgi:hypothetical protein